MDVDDWRWSEEMTWRNSSAPTKEKEGILVRGVETGDGERECGRRGTWVSIPRRGGPGLEWARTRFGDGGTNVVVDEMAVIIYVSCLHMR